MGPPGVSSGCFQRTIVGYTGVGHMTDRGLRLVLQTRAGFPPPQIRLPVTFWVRGIPVRRPALLPPASFRRASLQHRCLRLPFALSQAGSGLCPADVSNCRTAPFSSRAKARLTTIALRGAEKKLRSFLASHFSAPHAHVGRSTS